MTQEQTTCTYQRFRMYQNMWKRKYRKVSYRIPQTTIPLSAAKPKKHGKKSVLNSFVSVALFFTSWVQENYNHSLQIHEYCFFPILPATVRKIRPKIILPYPTDSFFPIPVVQQSNCCLAHLFFKVSRSHTIRHTHSVGLL